MRVDKTGSRSSDTSADSLSLRVPLCWYISVLDRPAAVMAPFYSKTATRVVWAHCYWLACCDIIQGVSLTSHVLHLLQRCLPHCYWLACCDIIQGVSLTSHVLHLLQRYLPHCYWLACCDIIQGVSLTSHVLHLYNDACPTATDVLAVI